MGNTRVYLGGDFIVAIDNDRVTNPQDVSEIMDRHQAGDTVTVTFFRGSRKMTAKLTLGEAHSISV
jgi:S1-C subfamily serine protease